MDSRRKNQGQQRPLAAPVEVHGRARGRRPRHRPARSIREAARGADGRGGPAIADRVYQPGEYAARAGGGPPARNGGPRGTGHRPFSPDASGIDRISAAFRDGWRAGYLPRVFRRRRAGADHAVRTAADRASHRHSGAPGCARAALHRRGRVVHGTAVRTGSRVERLRLRLGVFAAGGRQGERDAARPVFWKEPGSGAGGSVGGDVERCRAVYRPPVESRTHRSGLPPRSCSAADPRSGAQRV